MCPFSVLSMRRKMTVVAKKILQYTQVGKWNVSGKRGNEIGVRRFKKQVGINS